MWCSPPGWTARRPRSPDRRRLAPEPRPPPDRQRLWSAASHLAATRHGLAAARDGGTVLLLPLGPGDSATDLARQTARQLGAALREPVTVGASAPVAAPRRRPGTVAAAYAEARRCFEALRLLGRSGEGAAPQDFGFLGLLLADTGDIEGFVHRTIGPVVDYDARRGTDLVRTLDAYFASGMSPARTKDELHVHVNTVAQRLERIGRLLGEDWQSPGPRPGDPAGAAAARDIRGGRRADADAAGPRGPVALPGHAAPDASRPVRRMSGRRRRSPRPAGIPSCGSRRSARPSTRARSRWRVSLARRWPRP